MFFGDFVDDSKTFSISWGEREQLKEVAVFTKNAFEKNGSSYFTGSTKSKIEKLFNTVDCGDLGTFFIGKKSDSNFFSKKEVKNRIKSERIKVKKLKS